MDTHDLVTLPPPLPAPATTPREADRGDAIGDAVILAQWLHGRPPHTLRVYRRDAAAFQAFVDRPLRAVRLHDLQAYADTCTGAPATRARKLMAVKSLLSFASRLGYVAFNVGAALRAPTPPGALAERILSEEEVLRLLGAVADHPRDHALLRLLYNGGLRASEAAELRWRSVVDGVVNVTGKGGKTRVIRLSAGTWGELVALRPPAADPQTRVFGLSAWAIWHRVRRAAQQAGLRAVSPHWLRHAHATHALQRGADLATVSATLGHSGVATTSRYLHARPKRSSGDWLSV